MKLQCDLLASNQVVGGSSPSGRGKTHYYWGAAFDIADVPEDIIANTKANVTAAFDEDNLAT